MGTLAEKLLPSQEGLSTMGFISWLAIERMSLLYRPTCNEVLEFGPCGV